MKRLLLLVAVALALASLIPVQARQPGPPRTYTCSWTHDGTGGVAETFELVVDGTVAATVPNADPGCTGIVASRACQSPLTMTTNVAHTVYVRAVNVFGAATSDPFSASPPGSRPAGVVIR